MAIVFKIRSADGLFWTTRGRWGKNPKVYAKRSHAVNAINYHFDDYTGKMKDAELLSFEINEIEISKESARTIAADRKFKSELKRLHSIRSLLGKQLTKYPEEKARLEKQYDEIGDKIKKLVETV